MRVNEKEEKDFDGCQGNYGRMKTKERDMLCFNVLPKKKKEPSLKEIFSHLVIMAGL